MSRTAPAPTGHATQSSTSRVAIFSKFSPHGGVSRMMVNLANELAREGHAVDLLLAAGHRPYPGLIGSGVRVVDLGVRHVFAALLPLIRYIRRERPDAMLATRYRANLVALLARRLAGAASRPRLVLRIAGTISSASGHRRGVRRALHFFPVRRLYRWSDAIIAVSEGVASDLVETFSLPRERIHVLPNPAITPELQTQAAEPVGHTWFTDDSSPIILGVGRFTPRKDFATLIRAFARLHDMQPARLVLLGDGPQRDALRALAEELGVAESVDMPGFVYNPYPYMAHADLLVLSSTGAEGSPNVLKEALALGLPVVATDCPSGPREVLQDGRLGRLVPVGDAETMAYAMAQTLATPPNPMELKAGAAPYSVAASARRYAEVLTLAPAIEAEADTGR